MYDIMPRDEPDISRLLVPPKWPQLCDWSPGHHAVDFIVEHRGRSFRHALWAAKVEQITTSSKDIYIIDEYRWYIDDT